MNPLVQPQVNRNGTSRESLVEQQCAVLDALQEVRKAMAEAMPHGRDYQFRPAEYPAARDAWLERLQMIFALRQEIEQHALKIQEQER